MASSRHGVTAPVPLPPQREGRGRPAGVSCKRRRVRTCCRSVLPCSHLQIISSLKTSPFDYLRMASKGGKTFVIRTSIPIFQTTQEISTRALPTYADVIRHFLHVQRFGIEGRAPNTKLSNREIASVIADKVIAVWTTASIPTVTKERITKLIVSYHDKYKALLKAYKERKGQEPYQKKLRIFEEQSQKLFDVCSCRCKVLDKCVCEKSRKVPTKEHEFLLDQRGERKLVIGGKDQAETTKIRKREKRKIAELSRSEPSQDLPGPSGVQEAISKEKAATESSSTDTEATDSDEYVPSKLQRKKNGEHATETTPRFSCESCRQIWSFRPVDCCDRHSNIRIVWRSHS